ncbi:hypothetical protein MTR_0259s0040 [Medicago truncatula]|uniref:Uncharacterized protein n=1 Tax=Medicago truncatula TaxID=3880 RepID=A0A072TRR7_MEDTR|nr:hypothetical protein MTR_0259s0040 [Medicago truncatula]
MTSRWHPYLVHLSQSYNVLVMFGKFDKLFVQKKSTEKDLEVEREEVQVAVPPIEDVKLTENEQNKQAMSFAFVTAATEGAAVAADQTASRLFVSRVCLITPQRPRKNCHLSRFIQRFTDIWLNNGDIAAVKKLLNEAAVFNQTDLVFILMDSGENLEYKNGQDNKYFSFLKFNGAEPEGPDPREPFSYVHFKNQLFCVLSGASNLMSNEYHEAIQQKIREPDIHAKSSKDRDGYCSNFK